MQSFSGIIRHLNTAFIKWPMTPLTLFDWYYRYGIILILLKSCSMSFHHNATKAEYTMYYRADEPMTSVYFQIESGNPRDDCSLDL